MCKDVLNRISKFPSSLQYQSDVTPVDQSNQLTTLQVLLSKATAQVDTVKSFDLLKLKPHFECHSNNRHHEVSEFLQCYN